MLKEVIFDFDGVILDSFNDQFEWFKKICKILNKKFSYNTIEEFKADYKEPVYPNMYTFLGFDWSSEKDVIWREYNSYKSQAKIKLVDGIEKVIRELQNRNIGLAIASSNTREAISKQLKDHNLDSYFTNITSKEDLPVVDGQPRLKPDPACILIALEKLKCKPSDAVYVGDQPTDIEASKKVPIKIVAVTFGYSTREKLEALKPDHLVNTPDELLELLI